MRASVRVLYIFTLMVLLNTVNSAFAQDADLVAKNSVADQITSRLNTDIANPVIKNAIFPGAEADTFTTSVESRYKSAVGHLRARANMAYDYLKKNNYSMDYIFLVDMSLPSGKYRFFVYNIKKDTLECSSLVAHGFGSTIKGSESELIFSNNDYSCKTSLGKYKIGASYKGTYGLAYKLYGLDTSNSKAFARAIVLHSDVHIPDNETYPAKIFQSAGCPAVSPAFLPVLGKYIKASKKPILMWIYYGS